jgi:hypothetical protein
MVTCLFRKGVRKTSQKRLIPIILPTSEGRLDGSDGWAPFESSHPHAVVFLFALLVAAIAGARSLTTTRGKHNLHDCGAEPQKWGSILSRLWVKRWCGVNCEHEAHALSQSVARRKNRIIQMRNARVIVAGRAGPCFPIVSPE